MYEKSINFALSANGSASPALLASRLQLLPSRSWSTSTSRSWSTSSGYLARYSTPSSYVYSTSSITLSKA